MRNITQCSWSWRGAVVVVFLWTASTAYAMEPARSDGYANPELLVTPQQVAAQRRDSTWRLVDVRSPERYAAAHLPGAVNLPVGLLTQTRNGTPGMLAPLSVVTQALQVRGISRKSRVVIYDDFGGYSATRLFWVLDYLGHPRASLLQGGFDAWRQQGYPVSQETPQPQATRYQATPDAAKVADMGRVMTQVHRQDPNVILLDARSPAEFAGEVAGRQVQRPGHLPGAVNVDWVRNLSAPPRQFKAEAELLTLYQQAGVTPEKEIVVYCRTGMRASHDYFILRLLGYPRVRVYDGSYVEWAADHTAPVSRQ